MYVMTLFIDQSETLLQRHNHAFATNHSEPSASYDHCPCDVMTVDQQMHAYLLSVSDDCSPAFLTDKFNYLHKVHLFHID